MSLTSEIQALRTEIEAHARRTPSEDGNQGSGSGKASESGVHDQHDIESFLKEVDETLDAFADELDRFPRLTALTALGVGLAAGIVIGRQLR